MEQQSTTAAPAAAQQQAQKAITAQQILAAIAEIRAAVDAPQHSEPPYVWWKKVRTPDGSEECVTVRASAPDALRRQAEQVRQMFADVFDAPPIAVAVDAEPLDEPDKIDPGWCRIHNKAMSRHEKDGQVWYSHKSGDEWCRGTPPRPRSSGDQARINYQRARGERSH